MLFLESPDFLPVLLIHWKYSQNSTCICILSEIYCKKKKNTKNNHQRAKAHGAKSRGNQLQASKSIFPVESHRMCLIFPATSCDNMYDILFAKEAHQRPSTPCFVGAGHVVFFCMRTQPNSRLPENKQMFIINFVFLYRLGMVTYSYPEI